MFSRKNRVPREKLEEIIAQSKSLGGDFFNIKYTENSLDFPRFSIILSKKVCKSSVVRHLLKRRFVSVVRAYLNMFNQKDYVLFVKKEALKQNFKTLKSSFERFINQNSL